MFWVLALLRGSPSTIAANTGGYGSGGGGGGYGSGGYGGMGGDVRVRYKSLGGPGQGPGVGPGVGGNQLNSNNPLCSTLAGHTKRDLKGG